MMRVFMLFGHEYRIQKFSPLFGLRCSQKLTFGLLVINTKTSILRYFLLRHFVRNIRPLGRGGPCFRRVMEHVQMTCAEHDPVVQHTKQRTTGKDGGSVKAHS